MNPAYRRGRDFFKGILRFLFKVNVVGAEKFPEEEGLVVCCNHISNWDPMLLGSFCPRKVRYMAKEELFRIPLISSLLLSWGAFPVKRGAGDRAAIRTSLEIAQGGDVLGVFPEGTRSKTGKLGKALPGGAMIALRSGVRVVPVAIVGPYRLFRPLTIIYGEAIDLKELAGGKGNTALAAEIIMNEIQKLIDDFQSD